MPRSPVHVSILFLLLWPTTALGLNTSIVVTGANGYVGRAIVHELIQRQEQQEPPCEHSILCLVRPHRVAEEKAYWQDVLSSSSSRRMIHVLPYDMIDGGQTLRDALDQCHDKVCLYHVASVFGPTEHHQATALDNVKGTRDVMGRIHQWRTANDGSSCKVVLTSSMAAVRGTGQAPANGKFYTSEDWNTESVLGANWGASYQWSKRESELQARQLADQYQIPLVTLCPSFVFGPPYGESSSFSIQLVRQWAKGESPVQSRLLVDIRDVAAAHVSAGQSTSFLNGRLILSTDSRVPSRTMADWIRDVTAPVYREAIHSDDEFTGGAIPIGAQEVEAKGPLQELLGISLRPIQETMQDMTVRLLEQETAPASVQSNKEP